MILQEEEEEEVEEDVNLSESKPAETASATQKNRYTPDTTFLCLFFIKKKEHFNQSFEEFKLLYGGIFNGR